MFSIVIPTLGRTSLEELLNSIPTSSLLVSVVIVGDSTIPLDESERISRRVRAGRKLEIKWIRSDVPGVNAARNTGIREVTADLRNQVVLFLDDDVLLSEHFSWESLRDVYADPKILAVGGNYHSNERLGILGRGYNLMCSGWREASGTQNNEALLGGAWSIRAPELLQVCHDLGWFEESIQYGGAETPFVHRLRTWAASSWAIVSSRYLDVLHMPRDRKLSDWLRIAYLQNQRLDHATKAARPNLKHRLFRLGRFCRSLSIADAMIFLAFTIPFVFAGRVLSLFSRGTKSK